MFLKMELFQKSMKRRNFPKWMSIVQLKTRIEYSIVSVSVILSANIATWVAGKFGQRARKNVDVFISLIHWAEPLKCRFGDVEGKGMKFRN